MSEPNPSTRVGIAAEVAVVTALVAALIAAGDGVARLGGDWSSVGALVAGGGLLVAPLVAARWRHLVGDVLAVDPPLTRAIAAGLLASLVILPLFAGAYDVLQTRWLGHRRGHGVGLESAGWQVQGPPPRGEGWVAIGEGRDGLVVENRTAMTVTVVTREPQVVRPRQRALLPWEMADGARIVDATGREVTLLGGSAAVALPQPLQLSRGLGWLLTLLLSQLAAVALPEELCFRGYVLGRLRTAWPARRRVLGVPFGAAHIGSAALFALVHLVTEPAAHRLLVFFPALVFAWLAERTRSSVSAAVHHACCNVALQVLQRLYG